MSKEVPEEKYCIKKMTSPEVKEAMKEPQYLDDQDAETVVEPIKTILEETSK